MLQIWHTERKLHTIIIISEEASKKEFTQKKNTNLTNCRLIFVCEIVETFWPHRVFFTRQKVVCTQVYIKKSQNLEKLQRDNGVGMEQMKWGQGGYQKLSWD